MSGPKFFLNDIRGKRVVIAALDWGMGHVTRCVSVIQLLLEADNRVVFAGTEQQCTFIQNDFPGLETELIGGYKVRLDSNKNTYSQMAAQAKKVSGAIQSEKKWLKKYVKNNPVDLIISDNRYGFYHRTVPSVLITHQLNLQIPSFRWLTNKFLHKKIKKFDQCWVPDFEDRSLSGELSNANPGIPVSFIGLLNRFEQMDCEVKYDYLVILSGPEPERSNFLEYAIDFIRKKDQSVAFVGAKVMGYDSFNNPTTKELEQLINESKTVFSRAGYTTIMEMVGLNHSAILIPTKGQYEQMYLAEYVKSDNIEFVYQPS